MIQVEKDAKRSRTELLRTTSLADLRVATRLEHQARRRSRPQRSRVLGCSTPSTSG